MARRDNRAPRAPQAPATEPTVEQTTVEQPTDEVTEQTTPPPAEERPVKPVGTSNLATTIRSHRHRYVPALAPSGKKTANNGDRVAKILLVTPLTELSAFVLHRFGKRYDHLNTGHERMCCGNLVRAWAAKGDTETLAWLAAHEPQEAEAKEEAEA